MEKSERQQCALLICDDVSESRVISSLLRKVDFRVVSAPGDSASLDGFVPRGEALDLAIIDVGATTVNGSALLHSLHECYPRIRLVFMSSGTEESATEAGPAGHVRGYVYKPVRKAQLLGTVLAVMDAPAAFAA
jgi:DNA-binding NarL/FixJ family response regulator